MEDNERRISEIEIHGLSLIDVSSEDDSLLFSSFLDPSSYEFSENDQDDNVECFLGNAHCYEEEIPMSTLEEKEQVLQPHESPEPEKLMITGKYNLRKSLAWDNAFFTGAGVLEPEELSSMIESNHEGGKQNLSTIHEDLQKSIESISTFQSDCTVENSQEFDFFNDIRASIQKSAKASAAATPDKNKELVAIEAATSSTSSMVKAPVSQEKMKPKASPKKPIVRAQVLLKATKQPVAARGPNPSVSKPPKVLGTVRTMPTTSLKRASSDVNKTKQEKDSKLAGGKQSLGSRISISRSSRPISPRPLVSSKSSLRSSVASKNELTSSCSSLESCVSASSSVSHKCCTNLTRRKNDSSSILTSPSLTNRTISRATPRNVTQPRIPSLSTKGTSKSKHSSIVSPASSNSDRSSESSRASAPNKMAKGRQNTVSGARGLASSDRPHTLKPLHNPNDKSFVQNDSKVDEIVHEGTKQVSVVTDDVVQSASIKPSCLRVPTPKIGFFDGTRNAARTLTGNMQPRSNVSSGLPKHGSNSLNVSVTKTKSEKLQPARSRLQDSSNSKTKANGVSRSPRVISVSSPKVQKKMYSKISAEEQLKGEGDNERKNAIDSSSPSSVRYKGRLGKQSPPLAKETVKICPANGKLKSSVDQNSVFSDEILCIELPKEVEISDKAVYEHSGKLTKQTRDKDSVVTLETEKEYTGVLLPYASQAKAASGGDRSDDTSLKRAPLTINNSADYEDGIFSVSARVVNVAEKSTLTPLENVSAVNS